MSDRLDPTVFDAMRADLRAHLREVVAAANVRLFGPFPPFPPKVHFTARGICGWCAQPFMRRMEHTKGTEHAPVLYCKPLHKRRAMQKRTELRELAAQCPTPHKRTFLTEAVALSEMANYSFHGELTVYRCDAGCHGWHITKSRVSPWASA